MAQLPSLVEKKKSLANFIEANQGRVEQALKGLNLDVVRFKQVFYTAVNKEPKILDCTHQSVLSTMVQTAQCGLELGGPLGHAYPVPFKNKNKELELQLILGYRGLLQLMRNSGEILSLRARVVYEADEFDQVFGLKEDVVHKPSSLPISERGEITHSYFIANFINGGYHIEVLDREQINKAMMQSQSKGKWGPWKEHFDSMAMKTAIRAAWKMMPASVLPQAAHDALSKEEAIEAEYRIKDEFEEAPEPGRSSIGSSKKSEEVTVPDESEETPFD